MSSKKYRSEIEQHGDSWTARITRQVTSRKSITSKQQDGFNTEPEAQAWVDATLPEFISTQQNANTRHDSSRKEQQEIKRQRSSRRAEKTESVKREKIESTNQAQNAQSHTNSDFKKEFDSFES